MTTTCSNNLITVKNTAHFKKSCTFAADNVERFEDRKVPDSLQPHKKMLKVTFSDSIF